MSISVLTTGGTIASTLRDGRVAPAVRGRDLVDPRAAVDVHEVMAIDSATMTLERMAALRNATTAALADPRVEGVVVLHGTDTLEEAAILLDLFHSDPRPVVITGAQRPADDACPDGPGNIAAAIDIARDPNARHRGVLIAFGGQVHRARGTRKAHTTDLDAFESYLPEADEHCRAVLPWRQELIDVRVDIAALYPGADRAHIDASLTAGARGIVLDAMGSGNANRSILAAVADCVDRDVAVVVTSRVPHGLVHPVYGGSGGGRDLADAGAVHSPVLRAGQGRILLAALLAAGADRDRISTAFSDVVGLGTVGRTSSLAVTA